MANQVRNLFLIAFIIGCAYLQVSNATVTVTSNFDNYAQIVAKLSVMNERLRTLQAVWGEIRADHNGDYERVKTFYDNVLKLTEGANIAAEAEEAAELAAEVRHILVTVNGQLLAETLNRNDSQKILNVQNYRTHLFQKYSVDLLSAIFEQAIDKIYAYRRTDLLQAELSTIDPTPLNANNHKVRVNWNLYLYNKFLARGDINDKYVYEAALAFRNLKYSTYYPSLDRDSARRIDAAFDSFPSSLRVLFNTMSVCLENVNMKNYVLYFAESTASTASSYIPAVIRNRFESKSNDRLVWSNSFADRLIQAASTMYLKLRSNNWYLYRQAGTNQPLLVQRTDSATTMRNWTPSLMDKNIMFEQTGYYMCATQTFDSTLLGFSVRALQGIKPEDTNCQWILTDCSSL